MSDIDPTLPAIDELNETADAKTLAALTSLVATVNALDTSNLADLAVTAAKLAADSVTTAKILDANVTAAKLGGDAVTTVKILDANVTNDKLAATLADKVGVTTTATTRRGKTIVATEETVTSTSYTTLTTPDTVSSIVLPTDGLIFVGFQGMWKESVSGAARAAIFLGTDQLKLADNNATAAPAVQETSLSAGGAADLYKPLATSQLGLMGNSSAGTAYTGDVTTGQIIGMLGPSSTYYAGVVPLFAAAGTYSVSVKFKSSSGTVTAKNRKLWVWTMGF